jgi:hypothetical protein
VLREDCVLKHHYLRQLRTVGLHYSLSAALLRERCVRNGSCLIKTTGHIIDVHVEGCIALARSLPRGRGIRAAGGRSNPHCRETHELSGGLNEWLLT